MLGGFCSQQFCRLVTTICLHHTENNYKKVMNFLKFVKVRARFTENNLSSKTSQVALVVKNVPAKAGDIRDVGLTNRGQEDPLEEGVATHSRIPAWRIPRTEEPGALVCRVTQSRMQLKWLNTHAQDWEWYGSRAWSPLESRQAWKYEQGKEYSARESY